MAKILDISKEMAKNATDMTEELLKVYYKWLDRDDVESFDEAFAPLVFMILKFQLSNEVPGAALISHNIAIKVHEYYIKLMKKPE